MIKEREEKKRERNKQQRHPSFPSPLSPYLHRQVRTEERRKRDAGRKWGLKGTRKQQMKKVGEILPLTKKVLAKTQRGQVGGDMT